MRKNILAIVFCATLMFVGFSPIEKTSAKRKSLNPETPEARFALLVGINNYDDKTIPQLSGCENDVKLMRDVLSELYHFKPDADIKELISSDASKTEKPTRANIENFFREYLIKNAKDFKEKNNLSPDKGATVVFYYSGHGSYLPDQPTVAEGKDEADGYDETIVPSDSGKESGAKDIRDDDLNAWFKELRRYTTNITFIFDSCHSGTITRGVGNRSIDRAMNKSGTSGGGGDITLDGEMDAASGDYVTISGSLPNEKSQEGSMPILPKTGEKFSDKEQVNGYMTYYLALGLRANPGATYRELMRTVSTAVNHKNKEQTPQVEGDIDRAFLGSKESRGKRSIPITKIEKTGADTILTIEAGKIVGALPGGSVGIYKETATQLAGDADRIGVGKIIESGNFTSKVKIKNADVDGKAKIVLATPFFTDEKRKVAFDASGSDAGAQMLKRLKTLLDKNDYVAPLDASIDFRSSVKDWNVAVARGTFADFKTGKTKSAKKDVKTPKDTDEVFYLASPNGNPLYNFWVKADEDKAEEQIADALEKYTRVENILSLDNAAATKTGDAAGKPDADLKVELVRLKSWKPPESEGEPCAVEEYTAAEREKMKRENAPIVPGDYFYFEITNNTGRAMFAYLYDISTDGQIQTAFAPEADGDILPSGRTIPTIATDKCGGLYRAAEPYGKETFKLIATSKRFDAALLTSPKIARDIGLRGDNALAGIFAQASTNRRSDVVEIPFSGWATAKIDFEVTRK